jgi:MFS family permease
VRPGPARRRGGLLWHRDFRLLWTGETISGAGTAMAAAGVPLLAVTVLHAPTIAIAALTAAAYLPWLVIGLPAGAWADRLPVRPLMITCDLVSALLYASLPAAAWLGVLTALQVVVVALLAGAANVLFATAYQVLLPALVTAGALVEGNAKLPGSASVAAIGGRSAAGLAAQAVGAAAARLATASGVRNALWIILACYALSGALLLSPAILAHRDLPVTGAAEPGGSRVAPVTPARSSMSHSR